MNIYFTGHGLFPICDKFYELLLCKHVAHILGDLFGMFEDVLYCRLHFEMMTSYGPGDPLDMCPPLHSPNGKKAGDDFLGV